MFVSSGLTSSAIIEKSSQFALQQCPFSNLLLVYGVPILVPSQSFPVVKKKDGLPGSVHT